MTPRTTLKRHSSTPRGENGQSERPLNEATQRHEKTGVNVRLYPHLLRHLRATELYGILIEKEMMRWFGWSTRFVIDIYSHVKETRAVERVLSLYGPKKQYERSRVHLAPKRGTRNPAEVGYCYRYGTPVDAAAASVGRRRARRRSSYSISWSS